MIRKLSLAVLAAFVSGGAAPRAEPDPAGQETPLKLHMISGSREYKSEPSLKAFKAYLEKHYPIRCAISFGQDGKRQELARLEGLDGADVLLVFARRMKLPEAQTERVLAWCRSGRPVVGIRTASHAFDRTLNKVFDRQVMGGSYSGHGGGEKVIEITLNEKAKDHPALAGVKPWTRPGKLYRNKSNAEDSLTLLTGKGAKDTQPVAWAHPYQLKDKDGKPGKKGRAFYTSMGYPHDFENDNFRTLLVNAIYWTARRKVPPKGAAGKTHKPSGSREPVRTR